MQTIHVRDSKVASNRTKYPLWTGWNCRTFNYHLCYARKNIHDTAVLVECDQMLKQCTLNMIKCSICSICENFINALFDQNALKMYLIVIQCFLLGVKYVQLVLYLFETWTFTWLQTLTKLLIVVSGNKYSIPMRYDKIYRVSYCYQFEGNRRLVYFYSFNKEQFFKCMMFTEVINCSPG